MEGQQEGAADLELLDPTPNIHQLFKHYNAKYFEGKLSSVKLRWDTNMKLKSGEFIHRGKRNCEITLSEPLLKFRLRADLLNTLLHEMIHAYLFLTNAKDPDGHGPEFLRMASYINKMEKTNIQQYHNFRAEVEFYSQQWKCKKCSTTAKGTPKKCACGGAFVKVPNGSGAKSSTAKPGVGKSMTMDKFVVTKKKAEPPTAQPPAKRQRLSLHKEKSEETQSQELNQGASKRRTLSEAMEDAFLLGSDGESIFFVSGDFPISPCPLPLPSEKDSPFFMHSDEDVIVPKPLPSLHSKKKDTATERRPSEKREEIMTEDISIIEDVENENVSSMSEATPVSSSEPEANATGTNNSQDEEPVVKAVMPPLAVRPKPVAPSHAQPPSSAKGTPALPTKPKPPVQQRPSPQPQQLHQPQQSPPPKHSAPPKPSVPPPVGRMPSTFVQPPPRPVTKLPTTATTTHTEPPKPSRVAAHPRTAPPPPTRTRAPSSKAPTAPIALPNSGKAMKYPPPVVIPRRTPAPKPQPPQQPQKQQQQQRQQQQQTLQPAKPVPQFRRPIADTNEKEETKKTPDTSAHEGAEQGTSKETTTCFMCGSVVPGDSSSVEFNQHVDECLSRNFINAENM